MNTQLCWIIPPVWANECCEPSQTFSGWVDVVNACKVPENVVTLVQDLVEPFTNNKFGVDIDDKYRIVIFEDLQTTLLQNDTQLPVSGDLSQCPRDDFLRDHFKCCLGVHFLGGDIEQDFPDDAQGLMDKAREEGIHMEDPEWQTYPGTKVVELLMEHKLVWDTEVEEQDPEELQVSG